MKSTNFIVHLIIFLFLSTTLACGSGGGDSDSAASAPFSYSQPTAQNDGWSVDHVDNHNVDGEKLTAMMDAIGQNQFTNIDSIVIVRNNQLVFDELIRTQLDSRDSYIRNNDLRVHSMQSVSKSFVSALVGIAVDQGHISTVDEPFYDFFDEYTAFNNWDANKPTITLDNVLTMQHGWQWDEWSHPFTDNRNSLGFIYNNTTDYVKALLDLPMETTPGTTFAYSTIASVALGAAVENRTGIQLENYADTYLFEPLGIESAIWDFTPVGRAHTGGGLWLSSRDMAKFGQLYLDQGVWNGQQILSPEWVAASQESKVFLGFGHSDYYGYQWWNKTFNLSDGRSIFTYSAHGNGGQFIFVIPELNSVVVFTGGNYDSQAMYQPIEIMRQHILLALQ